MFLFITKAEQPKEASSINSNTSHVPIYQHSEKSYFRVFPIQIHLMFLFIRKTLSDFFFNVIQIHLMFLFIGRQGYNVSVLGDSNTSHVPIYPAYFRYFFFLLYECFHYFTRFFSYFPKYSTFFLLTRRTRKSLCIYNRFRYFAHIYGW